MRRHTILLVGLLVFFVGIQFRMVESFTLSDFSSQVVSSQSTSDEAATPNVWQATASRKVVSPPRWLGLALMSVGAVLTLRSMKPPKLGFSG